jgi:hypothetical protein
MCARQAGSCCSLLQPTVPLLLVLVVALLILVLVVGRIGDEQR